MKLFETFANLCAFAGARAASPVCPSPRTGRLLHLLNLLYLLNILAVLRAVARPKSAKICGICGFPRWQSFCSPFSVFRSPSPEDSP